MSAPANWAAALDRLAYVLGGHGEESRAAAEEWLRSTIRARYRVGSLYDLDRRQRQLAFQKTCGVVLALEDEPGDLAFTLGLRRIVASTFARYFAGACPEGPPWRIGPDELDRPTYAQWSIDQDDDAIPEPAGNAEVVVR